MKNGKIANLTIKRSSLFYRWLELTKPFHKLPKQEMKVLSLLLYYYDLYSGETSNIDIVWKMVFNYDTKVNIRTELDIKDQTLQNVLTRLRKKNVIKDNKILSTYIPNMEKDSTNFKIIFNFNVINEK